MVENNLKKRLELFHCSKDISLSERLVTIPGQEPPQIKMDVYYTTKDNQESIANSRQISKSLSLPQTDVDEVPKESLENYATSVVDSYFSVILAKYGDTNKEDIAQLILLPSAYKSCLLQGHGTYDENGRWAVSVGETDESIPVQELTKKLFDKGYKAIYLKVCNPLDYELPSSGGDKCVIYPKGNFGLLEDFGLESR